MVKPLRATTAVVLLALGGRALSGQASIPEGATVRLVPLKPVLSRTSALYQWRIVGRDIGSFASTNETTTISGTRLYADRLVAPMYTVEVRTTPHADGSMDVVVTAGMKGKPNGPNPFPKSSSTFGMAGRRQVPAASFAHPLVTQASSLSLPAKLDLIRVVVPKAAFGDVVATKFVGSTVKEAYRKTVPLNRMGFPTDASMTNPRLRALKRQGYQVTEQVDGSTYAKTFRLIVQP